MCVRKRVLWRMLFVGVNDPGGRAGVRAHVRLIGMFIRVKIVL